MFNHYHQEHLGIDINTRTTTVLWPVYKRLAFRKYIKETWLTPIAWRTSAKCAAHVMGVLCSAREILPIGAFLSMRWQWLINDAFKALPIKAFFTTGFNASQAKDRWYTSPLDATGYARRDLVILCNTIMNDPSDPSDPAWCRPVSLLVPRTHTLEGWSDACYLGLGE
jgi:hypothetical protein